MGSSALRIFATDKPTLRFGSVEPMSAIDRAVWEEHHRRYGDAAPRPAPYRLRRLSRLRRLIPFGSRSLSQGGA